MKTNMEQKLRQFIKNAMVEKRKNKTIETENRYQTLKNILETAQKSAKEKRNDVIADSMIIDAAKKEIKQLNDLLGFCKDNDAKVSEIEFNINVATELLPKMTTDEEVVSFVDEHKSEANNIGTMMKLLKATFGDTLDGKRASQIVKEKL